MVQYDFQNIVKNLLIFKWNYQQNLIMRIWRIKRVPFFIKVTDVNFSILKQLLLRYIVKTVHQMGSCVLKGLTVIDFILKLFDILQDLHFSQLNLLLPPLCWVEFLIIFSEIKAAIIQTFGVVFVCNLFTRLVKLFLALVQFVHFLVESRQDYVLSDLGLGDHDIEYIFIGIYFGEQFLY